MCTRHAALLFLFTLIVSAPAAAQAAVVFYAQTDASATSTAPLRNSSVGQIFVPAVSGNVRSIAVHTVSGGNGSVDCSLTTENVAHLIRPMYLRIWPFDLTTGSPLVSDYALLSASSTAPDANGNCFYNFYDTNDFFNEGPGYSPTPSSKGVMSGGALVAGQPYFIAFDGDILNWRGDIFGGSTAGVGAGYFNWIPPFQANDYNHANFFSGGVGVSSYFMTISDTVGFVSDHDVGTSGTSTPPIDPCATPGACVSSVLFLPGIEGSRLYRPDYAGGTDKLWEPNNNDDVRDLFLDPSGSSVRYDVYAKEGDVIDEIPDGENIYKSFIARMNDLKAAGTINDWEPIAYDWRLSLDDILSYGNDIDGRIYYSGDLRATSTPYVIQELRRLAATSQTGKVTIVAHSNGGLLAKRLTEILGPEESAKLIDKMIFVAVPQAGTPAAVASDLHGTGQELLKGLVLTKNTARTFASTSPMAYNLLPSAAYFTQVDNPVVSFDPSLPDWAARYGDVVHSQERLNTFLTDTFGRVDAQSGNINQPIQLSSSLLAAADTLHASLDAWTPPVGVGLLQIAGWGIPSTISSITYRADKTGNPEPDAQTTVDGDGTVVVPSALWTSAAAGAKDYWVDLKRYSNDHWLSTLGGSNSRFAFNHAKILETDPVLNFITDTIASSTKPLADYGYISIEAPASTDSRLRFALHSPLTLNLYDTQGRHTGISTTTGAIETQIPGTYYTEVGDTKYLFSDASTTAHIVLDGYASGTFTFDVDEYQGDLMTASTTFADIPTATSTVAALDISGGVSTLSPMRLDLNGDGTTDYTLAPKLDGTVTLDTTPPELRVSFSTSTQALVWNGSDDSGSVTVTATTTYPTRGKKGKEEREERDDREVKSDKATITTVTARDASGNTTALVYTEKLPTKPGRIEVVPLSVAYNGATTTLSGASISYQWKKNKKKGVVEFSASLTANGGGLDARYKPEKNETVITTYASAHDDRGDRDDERDSHNGHSTRKTLPGMVIPYMETQEGKVIINY